MKRGLLLMLLLFACVDTRCSYRRHRDATFAGCGANTTTGLWVLGAALLFLRRSYFLLKLTK